MEPEKQSLLFLQLVTMFHGACMQYLGKVHNPLTDKSERDLPQAQLMIDLLDMIQLRMKGNLSKEEESFLSGALREAKLNYVDESAKGDIPPAQS